MDLLAPAIGIIWLAFWVYWLVEAFRNRGPSVRTGQHYVARVLVLAITLAILNSPLVKGHDGSVHSLPLEVVGVLLFLAGLGTAVWARLYLGTNWGMPMSERVNPKLITTGPYRYARHPIYSGIILAGIGTALALNLYGLVVTAIFSGYFVFSATVEERNMARRFPGEFSAYKASSKMLIPFVF